MTSSSLLSVPATRSASASDGYLVLGGHRFHPLWLLDRSLDPADADGSNRQRLFEPTDVADDLKVVDAIGDGADLVAITFSDGRIRTFEIERLLIAAGSSVDALPVAQPWDHLDALPTLTWDAVLERGQGMHHLLTEFHRLGAFVITGAPTEPGSLRTIAAQFGRVSPTSFGDLFDVESKPDPDDLAYTPVGLSAHLDQPYRRPTPGLQFLHTLVNDAAGGASTVVDGLAGIEALRTYDPASYGLLASLPIEFRYDIGTDVVMNTAPIIDLHLDGSLRQLRFSTRLDFAPYADIDVLDRFYAARRWLSEWFNDEAHQLEFKMRPGDVLVVDNHRVLHGRRPFDPSAGHRHLQGCYVDHDGPATAWRLLDRQLRSTPQPRV